MTEWLEDDQEPCLRTDRWPRVPADLLPRERRLWWEQLWSEITLGERYRIRSATDWSENGLQVEALPALAAWVARYDSGEWDDPPGKLSLLYDLERVRALIRGTDPFHPDRDRAALCRFLIDSGCQPPPGGQAEPRHRR